MTIYDIDSISSDMVFPDSKDILFESTSNKQILKPLINDAILREDQLNTVQTFTIKGDKVFFQEPKSSMLVPSTQSENDVPIKTISLSQSITSQPANNLGIVNKETFLSKFKYMMDTSKFANLKSLLEQGAPYIDQLYDFDKNGQQITPLHYAITMGRFEAAIALIDSGCSLDILSKLALINGQGWIIVQIFQYLIQKDLIDVNTYRCENYPLFHLTLATVPYLPNNPYHMLIDLILEHNLDVNLQYMGYSPIQSAILGKQPSTTIQKLIDHGGILNSNFGNPVLQDAISVHPTIVPYLISQGADVNAVNPKTGLSVAHTAVLTSNYDIVVLLFIKGAQLSVADIHGNTPLHYAAFYGSSGFVGLTLRERQKKNEVDITKNFLSKEVLICLLHFSIIQVVSMVSSISQRVTRKVLSSG